MQQQLTENQKSETKGYKVEGTVVIRYKITNRPDKDVEMRYKVRKITAHRDGEEGVRRVGAGLFFIFL